MYLLRDDKIDFLKGKFRQDYFAREIGISATYVSLIFNQKKTCPKRIAFCFVKAVSKDAEIEDFFVRVK